MIQAAFAFSDKTKIVKTAIVHKKEQWWKEHLLIKCSNNIKQICFSPSYIG